MSFQAMTIANAVKIPAAKKALLFVIANYSNDQNLFWPSYQTLADDAGLGRRTVINYMAEFEEMGLIAKTRRVKAEKSKNGKNLNDSNIYTFTAGNYLTKNGYVLEINDKGFIVVNRPSAPAAPPLVHEEHHPSAPDAPPLVHELHPNLLTEPVIDPVIEPVIEDKGDSIATTPPKKPKPKPKSKPKSKDAPKPNGVDDQVWADWLDQRKQLKASTSQTVITRLQNQANDAGISLNEVFCIMLERGWKSFQADWIEKDKATPLPDDFQFTAERQIACQKLAPELGDEIHASFNRFITYVQRDGKRYQNWDAALESWILGDLKRFKEQQQGMKTFKDRDGETARMSLVKNLTDTSWAEGLDLDDTDNSIKALRAI